MCWTDDDAAYPGFQLTRPWSVKKSYMRLPTVIWTENNCTEDLTDVFIGKEQ